MTRALRILTLALLVLLPASLRAGETALVVSDVEPGIALTGQTGDALTFRVTVGALSATDVATKGGRFVSLAVPGFYPSRDVGRPCLPVARRLFEIPVGARVSVEVRAPREQVLRLSDFGIDSPLLPAQPSVSKSSTEEERAFYFDRDTYDSEEGFGYERAGVVDLGWLRGVRVGRLDVSPVRYRPKSGTLTVAEDLEVVVRFEGADRDGGEAEKARAWSPFFEPVYERLAGYESPKGLHDSHPDLLDGPVTYVIVSPPAFETELRPFVEWKTEQGFRVIEAYTDDPQVGSTTTSIEAYLHGLYAAGTLEDPAPTFVLFVGDVAQLPTFTLTTLSSSHPTDLPYCDATGDGLPDMYYGRFSAQSVAQLEPQIAKTLEYEKYEMPASGFLGSAVLVAGVDGTFAKTHGNGQIRYTTRHYFNAAHGYAPYIHLYPGTEEAGANTLILSEIGAGCGVVNYTGHGAIGGWSNPAVTEANVQALMNEHEYPLVIANCCLTSTYSSSLYSNTCFGETWLRAVDGGAVGYIGAADETYWDEDYYWAVGDAAVIDSTGADYEDTGLGMFDGMFHDHGEAFGQWYVVADAHVFAGNLAVTESGAAYSAYYWESYNLLGDPSLSAYLGAPVANTVTVPEEIDPGEVAVAVTAAPKSYVGITRDGALLGGGLVGEDGTGIVRISDPGIGGSVRVVVTAQNRIPWSAEIPLGSGPENCLSLSQGTLDFGRVVEGTEAVRPAGLWNLCAEARHWDVVGHPDWVRVDPDSGTLNPSPALRTLLVTLDADTLSAGETHSGSVRIQSAAGACTLFVTAEVRSADVLAAPVLVTPRDSVEVATRTPVLVAEAAVQVSAKQDLWVQFEADTSLSFSSPLVQRSGEVGEVDTTVEWQTGLLLDNARWYWRCWRLDSYAVGDTSAAALFYVNVAEECPSAFSLTAPSDDSTLTSRRPVFGWSASHDPDPKDSVRYRLFVHSGAGVDSLDAGTAPGAAWPSDLADNAVYTWQVSAADVKGCLRWSDLKSFTVNLANDAPGAISLLAPDSSGVASELRPLFQWSAAQDPDPGDAVTFWIGVSQDSLFGDFAHGDSATVGPQTSYEVSGDLGDNSFYFWTVRSRDRQGAETRGPAWKFAVDQAPPGLTFAAFQNPVLERYLDFYAVASESLPSAPVLSLRWSTFDALVPMELLDSPVRMYSGSTEIPGDVSGRARVVGCDAVDVCSTDSLDFTSAEVKAGLAARVLSWDGRAELDIPAGAVTRDRRVFILPHRGSVPGAKDETAPADMGGRRALGEALCLGPTDLAFSGRATLTLHFRESDLDGASAYGLAVYRLDAGGWVRLEPIRTGEGSAVAASIERLGVYQLRLDPDPIPTGPDRYRLSRVYPNPFNPSTTVEFDLPVDSPVSIRIIGVDGRLVRVLMADRRPAGSHAVTWDGTDDSGRRVASGVYFCEMRAGRFLDVTRLVLLK